MKADLKYPIIITYSNGKYDMIIDGNHRLHKAVELGDDNIQAKVLDLSKVSDEWLGVFG
jgi:ParB-like chromosome segregation protein Spo0J